MKNSQIERDFQESGREESEGFMIAHPAMFTTRGGGASTLFQTKEFTLAQNRVVHPARTEEAIHVRSGSRRRDNAAPSDLRSQRTTVSVRGHGSAPGALRAGGCADDEALAGQHGEDSIFSGCESASLSGVRPAARGQHAADSGEPEIRRVHGEIQGGDSSRYLRWLDLFRASCGVTPLYI